MNQKCPPTKYDTTEDPTYAVTAYVAGTVILHVELNVGPTPTDMPLDVDERPTRYWIHRADHHRLLRDCDKRYVVQIQAS